MAFQYRGLRVSARAAEKYRKTVWFCAEHVRLVSYNRLMAYSITKVIQARKGERERIKRDVSIYDAISILWNAIT